jgi:hypothetical protein
LIPKEATPEGKTAEMRKVQKNLDEPEPEQVQPEEEPGSFRMWMIPILSVLVIVSTIIFLRIRKNNTYQYHN